MFRERDHDVVDQRLGHGMLARLREYQRDVAPRDLFDARSARRRSIECGLQRGGNRDGARQVVFGGDRLGDPVDRIGADILLVHVPWDHDAAQLRYRRYHIQARQTPCHESRRHRIGPGHQRQPRRSVRLCDGMYRGGRFGCEPVDLVIRNAQREAAESLQCTHRGQRGRQPAQRRHQRPLRRNRLERLQCLESHRRFAVGTDRRGAARRGDEAERRRLRLGLGDGSRRRQGPG